MASKTLVPSSPGKARITKIGTVIQRGDGWTDFKGWTFDWRYSRTPLSKRHGITLKRDGTVLLSGYTAEELREIARKARS